ncbi:hypothetical protein MOQ_006035 [Trypanosoma cruzi marinkellei]|uniref:PIN domain-containing protein n=1 Tax=Trypanosoma cruzi marinkellei TaxID=85056 RepID=K2MSZ2_TRYCR|nr:hypothetical protein MOQ_006035 [Trypanosoma cruzi marinkellei]
MSHIMGKGVTRSPHRRKSVPQQWRTFTPREVYATRVAQGHEDGGGTAASSLSHTNGCLPPATHVSESLRKRLREHTMIERDPSPCHITHSSSAVAATCSYDVEKRQDGRIVTSVRGSPHVETIMAQQQKQQKQQQRQEQQLNQQSRENREDASPSRPQNIGRGGSEPLESSLALLRLYSRYCEDMEARKLEADNQRVESYGTNTETTTSNSINIVRNGHPYLHDTAERRIKTEMCSQNHTMPEACTQSAHASSKGTASATVKLCAKKAQSLFVAKRHRTERIKGGKQLTEEVMLSAEKEEADTNRILSLSAPGSKFLQETHGTSRLTELRACLNGNDSAFPPQTSAGQLLTRRNTLVPVHTKGSSLPSRLEEIRRHIEKYSAAKDQVAARPMPLQQVDIAQGHMSGWTGETSMPPAPCANLSGKLQKSGISNGIVPESTTQNGVQHPFKGEYHGEHLLIPTFSGSQHKDLHVVFDTCSLLEANVSILDGAIQQCIVCIPFDVIAELDAINSGKGNRSRGKTESRQLRFSSRQIRNWIASAIEKGANIRVQRRCEVEMFYDRKVATKDDSILGFAVFLEQQQLTVEFVTNDKFLRVKAFSELKGKVYNLSEFLHHHGVGLKK